jgi:membrane dipeptidase
VNETPRNLSDGQLRRLAQRDGIFGVMLHPLAIDSEQPTIERVVDHLDHAASVIGPDRVCLAGDWIERLHGLLPPMPPDSLMPPGLAPGTTIEGLAGPEDYPALVDALRARGWEGDRLEGLLSANLLRFLREALPTA